MMKTILAAAAALSLMAGTALALPPGVNCQTNPSNGQNHSVGENAGAAAGEAPAGATCETFVAPNGREHVQNGPAANDPGMDTAPHEGSGNGSNGGSP